MIQDYLEHHFEKDPDDKPALPVLLDFQSANLNPPALSRWLFSNLDMYFPN